MPAKPTNTNRRAKVYTLGIIRPSGPAHTEGLLADQEEDNVQTCILPPTASNNDVLKVITKKRDILLQASPAEPVDLLLAYCGGTGSGKGLTSLGSDGERGVTHGAFENQGGGIQVFELEPSQPPGSFTAKDLTSPQASAQKIVRQPPGNNLQSVIKLFKTCGVDHLRTAESRRKIARVEHARSSRTTVVMTSQVTTSSGRSRITIIDPPGRESPSGQKTGTSQRKPAGQEGTVINQTYLDLLAFIDVVKRGNLTITGRRASLFSSLLPLHNDGNRILLCIIGVLYGNKEPTGDISTRTVDMASRDLEVQGLIMSLKGMPKQDIDRVTSQGHRQVQREASKAQDEENRLKAGKDNMSSLFIIKWKEEYVPSTLLQGTNLPVHSLLKTMAQHPPDTALHTLDDLSISS